MKTATGERRWFRVHTPWRELTELEELPREAAREASGWIAEVLGPADVSAFMSADLPAKTMATTGRELTECGIDG